MRKLTCLVFAVLAIMVSGVAAFAAPAANFSVKAEIPDNQVDRSKSYFDLRLAPGEKQTVRVGISNSAQEPIMATVTLNPATTGQNGIILYNMPAPGSMEKYVSIMDVARLDTPQLRVEAGDTATAEITIEMPKDAIEGALLGGIVFTAEKIGAETSQSTATGISLQNEIEYIVGLKITESDSTVSPDFTLVGVEAGQANHRTAILATLENIQPVVVKGMNVQGEIYRGNATEAIQTLTLNNVEAAPHSSFPLVFDWQNARIEAGDYLLKLRVEHEGREWAFDQGFAISGGQADNSNRGAVNITPSGIPGWMLILVVILAAALIYFLWDKFKRRKRAQA